MSEQTQTQTKGNMLLRLGPDMAERLKRVASYRGISAADLARSAVYDAIRTAEVEIVEEEAKLERARQGALTGSDESAMSA